VRLILDTCISGGIADQLRQEGHDVIWTGDWLQDPGDDEILDYAFRENRILITLDKDFGTLAILHNRPHSGMLRLVNWATQDQAGVCLKVLKQYEGELQAKSILTVEPGHIRIRPTEVSE